MTNMLHELTPRRAMLWLIAVSTAIRLAFAEAVGLGVDESYMVAAGRVLRWGYFDHPPLAWWVSHLAWNDSAFAVRLPFIALFALSTWLMFRLTASLFDERAGLWAALALNVSPVFGVSSGSWVLPDGPMICALLGMAVCLVRGLEKPSLLVWIGVGIGAGLALLSKYTAVLPIFGVLAYLFAIPRHRGLLRTPYPWLALLVAFAVFSPVLIWNAAHGWISFAFQGGRAGGARFNPLGPLIVLGGEALFVLPWLWLPMMIVLWTGLRRGQLMAFMAAGPVILFALLGFWSPRILFHWAAAGYLFLFPLLGVWLAARRPRRMAWATAGVLVSGAAVAVLLLRVNPWPLPNDPGMQAFDWTLLRAALAERGLLSYRIAAPNWSDAGKIDYALGGDPAVICLNIDARQYLFAPAPVAGDDILIIAPRQSEARIRADYAGAFAAIEALPPVVFALPGRPRVAFGLFLGRRLDRGFPALQHR